MSSQTEVVKVYSVEAFERKVAELNRKAAKAAVAPVLYTLGAEWIKEKVWQRIEGDEVEVVYFYKEAVIVWQEIVYQGGWRLQGVIDHQERLVKSVPGSAVGLQEYKERGAVCDHCHTLRDRKETFVLQNEAGEVVQVGRSCIHLFLGVAVERALAGVGLSSGLGGLAEEQSGARQPFGYGLESFLASAATVIRLYGWRSRSAASSQQRATADLTWDNLENGRRRLKDRQGVPLWVDASAEDLATAKQVVGWLVGLGERSGLNDYLSNLAQIGANDFVSHKSAGFAASAVVAWGKEVEEEIKRAAERSAAGRCNEYLGTVGERLAVGLATLVKSPGFDSQYGYTFIHRFVDSQGHVIVWKTGTELDLGQYSLLGAVKAHDEYRGEKQTVLTRVKVGLPKEVVA